MLHTSIGLLFGHYHKVMEFAIPFPRVTRQPSGPIQEVRQNSGHNVLWSWNKQSKSSENANEGVIFHHICELSSMSSTYLEEPSWRRSCHAADTSSCQAWKLMLAYMNMIAIYHVRGDVLCAPSRETGTIPICGPHRLNKSVEIK